MGKGMRCGIGLAVAVVLMVSCLLTDTFGWQNLDQSAKNELSNVPVKTGTVRVKKVLAGDYPAGDRNTSFAFTLTADGKENTFRLKDGQTQEFTLVAGTHYEVREGDAEHYQKSMKNGTGTVTAGQVIEVTATNTYVLTESQSSDERVTITGEKTWDLRGQKREVLPESITVQLYHGSRQVRETTVKPDHNGRWTYRFSVPKYDADGNEIKYTVQEVPVNYFTPTYRGYNIRNTYRSPVMVDPPVVRKTVQGEDIPELQFEFLLRGEKDAPMPEGSNGNTKIISLTGNGQAEFGEISFGKPGTYEYTITEINSSQDGWIYDNSVYHLTVTVTEQQGKLGAKSLVTKNGEQVSEVVFTNRYEPGSLPDTVIVAGRKIWNHGTNPADNWPKGIIVEVYGDGVLAVQRQVTENENWEYLFELPRYAPDGHTVVYTVDEVELYAYEKSVDGYDLINTYQPYTTPNKEKDPGKPQTGDTSMLWLLVPIMCVSGGLLVLLILLYIRKKRKK